LFNLLWLTVVQESGHAFILRRFDTDAVSLTTMFRAAFPNAPEADEKAELQYVRDTFDLTGNNGSSRDQTITRLAGVWVSPALAVDLAHEYHLESLIAVVVSAKPDPNVNYRRSGKAKAEQDKQTSPAKPLSSTGVKSLPTPSPTGGLAQPPSAKKRREATSPAPSGTTKPPSTRSSVVPATPTKSQAPPTPRRSGRATRSPAPPTSVSSARTRVRKETKVTTSASVVVADLEAVDEENAAVEENVTGFELHQEDIQKQKELVAGLKAEMSKGEEELEAMDDSESARAKKRSREDDEAPRFEFQEPENEERAIATNARVRGWEPRSKSVAWGLAAFAVGMGAV